MNDNSHKQLCKKLAEAYYTFLTTIYSAKSNEQRLYLNGINHSDCKGHFLSNAYLSMYGKHVDFVSWVFHSVAAKRIIEAGKKEGIIFEHIVPKQNYIQNLCEQQAIEGKLTVEFIYELLCKYWFIALITSDENKNLLKDKMPNDWDGQDIFARYKHTTNGTPIQLFDCNNKPAW